MRSFIKTMLGVNGAALIKGARLGPRALGIASRNAFSATDARESAPLSAIPKVDLVELLAGAAPVIKLRVSAPDDGALPYEQALALLALLVKANPAAVLEIGTFMGYTTRLMAESLESATIHTIDLPEDFSQKSDTVSDIPKDDFHLIQRRVVGREFKNLLCATRITQHFGDTARWDFANARGANFFFIDGSHTYEYCKNDSEKCFELCAGKGVFLWHDCDDAHPGVLRFVTEWRRQGRKIVRIKNTPLGYWDNLQA